jgi:hypothetical protein
MDLSRGKVQRITVQGIAPMPTVRGSCQSRYQRHAVNYRLDEPSLGLSRLLKRMGVSS